MSKIFFSAVVVLFALVFFSFCLSDYLGLYPLFGVILPVMVVVWSGRECIACLDPDIPLESVLFRLAPVKIKNTMFVHKFDDLADECDKVLRR